MKKFLNQIAFCLTRSAFLVLAGCSFLGAAANKGLGSDTIKAQYTLPKDQTILVLVESYKNTGEINGIANSIGLSLQKDIETLKLEPTVNVDSLNKLKDRDP